MRRDRSGMSGGLTDARDGARDASGSLSDVSAGLRAAPTQDASIASRQDINDPRRIQRIETPVARIPIMIGHPGSS